MIQGSEENFLGAPFLQHQLDSFTTVQQDSERQETAAAIKLRRDLSAALAVPEECLISCVPVMLKAVDDHVIFPFSPFWSKSRMRWMRVSNFDSMAKICHKFKGVLLDKIIVMHVMAYISPSDAYRIHQMIENPGRIELLREAPVAGESRVFPISSRSGILALCDPRAPADASATLHLNFIVMNYGLLWAKASEYSMLLNSLGPARDLNMQLEAQLNCILQDPEAVNAIEGVDHLAILEEACDQAKRELLLSLYKAGFDPHDAILATDAEVHEDIYDLGYDPCYPNDRTNDEMRALTADALQQYMLQLRNENPNIAVHSVREAKRNVLTAESLYAVEACRSESIKQIYDAIKACKQQLDDALNKMNLATSRPSLIGVIGRDARTM